MFILVKEPFLTHCKILPPLPNSNALAPELTFIASPALPSEVKPVPPFDTGIVGKFAVGTEPVTFDDDKSIEILNEIFS